MNRRKYDQIKNYSKIIKRKRQTGQIQEVTNQQSEEMYEEKQEKQEQKPSHDLNDEEFEDQEDEFEEEEGWISDDSQQEPQEVQYSKTTHQEEEMAQEGIEGGMAEEEEGEQEEQKVFLGSNKTLKKGEMLEFDNRAYDMLHRLSLEWPAMSLDFICRNSPFESMPAYQQMTKYPYQVYTIQGSCTSTNHNSLYLTKYNNLSQTKYDDDPQHESDEDEPQLVIQQMATTHDINRIRSLNNSPVVAYWNDNGHGVGEIRITDLSGMMEKAKNNVGSKKKEKGKEFVISGEVPGFGLCWNPISIGELAVGNSEGVVKVLVNSQDYSSWNCQTTYKYHKSSVEDIVYSPNQAFVFASCSSDGTLQVVDTRTTNTKKSQILINAHKQDVNVCDWNKMATHLIATGSDDCSVKIWDLRMAAEGCQDQVLAFTWHTEPITSVKFQPNDESTLAVASEDNRLTIWDMSAENEEAEPQIPNELMFLHQGQQQIKEIAYHPIYFEMLASTALDGINIFKPAFQMPQNEDEGFKQDLKKPPIKEEDLDKYIGRLSLE